MFRKNSPWKPLHLPAKKQVENAPFAPLPGVFWFFDILES